MTVIDMREALADFEKLLTRVAKGEEVAVAIAGRPVARLVPVSGRRSPPRLGFLTHGLTIPDDFDRLGDEAIREAFEGGDRD